MRNLTFFLAIAAIAQNKPAPADLITDKMRYELAAAQRDYLLAEKQMEAATRALREKMEAAERACGDGKTFDPQHMACAEKPAEKK